MIIDTHLHVWELHSKRYPWNPLATIAPDYAWPVKKEIETMDLFAIDKGVLVQPSMYRFDNRYLLNCGRRFPDRFRLVGLVDPRSDTVVGDIEALAEQGVRGLRLGPMLRPDIPWYNHPKADRVWKCAGQLGLVITLLVTPEQVVNARQAIQRFPETIVIIDHLARPDKGAQPGSASIEALCSLAEFEQVAVKVSALGFMSRRPYPHPDILDLVKQVFDQFGPGRMMWGTDTPMSQDPGQVHSALELIDLALPGATSDEISMIKGGTAARIFGWS